MVQALRAGLVKTLVIWIDRRHLISYAGPGRKRDIQRLVVINGNLSVC
jgi:hypothetical protein